MCKLVKSQNVVYLSNLLIAQALDNVVIAVPVQLNACYTDLP